jgi:hypothetical protein
MPDEPARSAEVLTEIMSNSAKLRELAAQDPAVQKAISDGLINYLPTPALVSNATIYICVVAALGLVAVFAMIGAIVIACVANGPEAVKIPETVTALGSAAIGALAGLLAPSPGSRRQ